MMRIGRKVTFQRLRTSTLIFGLSFLAIGSAVSALFMCSKPFDPEFYIVLIFPGIGIIALLSGGQFTIDPARSRFSVRYGIWGLFRQATYDFSQVKSVQVVKKIIKTSKSTTLEYPVNVVLSGGETLLAAQKNNFLKSRRIGEQISKLLKADYRDKITGKGEARKSNELDMSLRQRLNSQGEALPIATDSTRRVRAEHRSGEVIFHLSERGFAADFLSELLTILGFGIIFSAFVGYYIMKRFPELFWPMTLILILGPLIKHAKESQKIKLTRDELSIQRYLMGLPRTQKLKIEDIEELAQSEDALILRTDYKEIKFAEILTAEERKTLRAMILTALKG